MKTAADKAVRLSIVSVPSHLPIVRAATEKMCQLVGFDAEATGGIILSVDEGLTNIIRHAYDGAADRPIEIELSPIGEPPEGIQISLRDYGPGVDPSRMKGRDLDDIRPGGLGIHIMSRCMDHLEYRPAEGGGTLLVLVKKLTRKLEPRT